VLALDLLDEMLLDLRPAGLKSPQEEDVDRDAIPFDAGDRKRVSSPASQSWRRKNGGKHSLI
jgi:hypothetical protein